MLVHLVLGVTWTRSLGLVKAEAAAAFSSLCTHLRQYCRLEVVPHGGLLWLLILDSSGSADPAPPSKEMIKSSVACARP